MLVEVKIGAVEVAIIGSDTIGVEVAIGVGVVVAIGIVGVVVAESKEAEGAGAKAGVITAGTPGFKVAPQAPSDVFITPLLYIHTSARWCFYHIQ